MKNKWRILRGLSFSKWRTGGEIRQELKIRNYAYFYIHLTELEDESLIESRRRKEAAEGDLPLLGIARREYRLTPAGAKKRRTHVQVMLIQSKLKPVT